MRETQSSTAKSEQSLFKASQKNKSLPLQFADFTAGYKVEQEKKNAGVYSSDWILETQVAKCVRLQLLTVTAQKGYLSITVLETLSTSVEHLREAAIAKQVVK